MKLTILGLEKVYWDRGNSVLEVANCLGACRPTPYQRDQVNIEKQLMRFWDQERYWLHRLIKLTITLTIVS
ncbi:hypothetical protein, partial [Malonomonas rubra]|uniref:hypothetical protein n=1 Tax=Malonomonas rubra TaxID=57040 RepID=UPI0026F2C1EC